MNCFKRINNHIIDLDSLNILGQTIQQGSVGNCYFLAAIAAIGNRRPDVLLENFVTQQINKPGIYGVKFCLHGVWRIIFFFIDDYFLVLNNKPVFSAPKNNAIWVMILEKAWAKLSGSYSNSSSGQMTEALNALTGASTESIDTNKKDFKQTLNLLLEKKVVMCAATPNKNQDILPNGLVSGHAYSILKIIIINHPQQQQVELVKLRNPWGSEEWKGDWGHNSPLWTPVLKEQIKLDKDRGGVFYMDYKQVIKEFQYIDVCHVRRNYTLSSLEIQSKKNHGTYISFKIEKEGEYFISLTQKNKRFPKSPKFYSLGKLIIIGKLGNNLSEIIEEKANENQENWTNNMLMVGEYYIYSKVQWKQDDYEVYGVSIYGPSKITLKLMDLKPKNLLKQSYIRMAKKQQNKIIQNAFSQIQTCSNFDIENCFGYYYIENTSEQILKVTVTFKLKDLKLRKPFKGEKFNLELNPGHNELFLFKVQSLQFRFQDILT